MLEKQGDSGNEAPDGSKVSKERERLGFGFYFKILVFLVKIRLDCTLTTSPFFNNLFTASFYSVAYAAI